MATLRSSLRKTAARNLSVLRNDPLSELSGALGDLGTLLPLMTALAVTGSIDLPATLVFSGLANILTGTVYGIPLPVQPMKAIAAVAIAQNFSEQETAAAGLTVGAAAFMLSATGLLRWLHRVVPDAVVKGIQVGAGLSLAISAGTKMVLPLGWFDPEFDNRVLAIVAFLFLILASLWPRVPYAMIVSTVGLVIAIVAGSATEGSLSDATAGVWHPHPFVPSGPMTWRTAIVDAAIPQLPLTTLNSILAVVSLSSTLFPDDDPTTPSTTSIGFSVATANLLGCWFGAMPICHGSGGLAGQYRFGARSGASVIILGTVKLLLGVFVGEAVVPVLQAIPKSLLGVMVFAAGVELAKVGRSVELEGKHTRVSKTGEPRQSQDAWMVMLITAAGCLACKNDGVGFLAGMVWHWASEVPQIVGRARRGRDNLLRRSSLDSGDEEADNLLN